MSQVAVKILYPSLRKEMASDFAMFRRLGGQVLTLLAVLVQKYK
jgi:predicted unusual protein kinase regulating ubiquinone biosynthesis (AarF/ABC1/UbiB family)